MNHVANNPLKPNSGKLLSTIGEDVEALQIHMPSNNASKQIPGVISPTYFKLPTEMKYLPVKFYHFLSYCWKCRMTGIPMNTYIQLEPLCTNPNLLKYVRCMQPKSVDDNDLLDWSEWKDTFLLDPTMPKDQEEIAGKFNVTRDRKEYIDARRKDMENTVCTEYFNPLTYVR